MENGEVKFEAKIKTDESGYSEKKLDQNTELQAGQWLDLNQDKKKVVNPQIKNKKPKIKNVSDDKFVQALESVNIELKANIDNYLSLISIDLNQADTVLKRIIELQTTQKSLLQALKWKAKGSLDLTKLPKQVQNLLK